MKKSFCFIISGFCLVGFAQSKPVYPQDYFLSPLKISTEASGTFGELRGNHFHSGFDFKTQQKEGQEVVAVADGFISRIKYSAFGYGKAIYVTHPNGFTTVYGHLQKANPEIEKYVAAYQYKKQAFEVELFPKKGELPVTKGQLLAYSGNTGGSGGPHLHFEYRDSATEEIINPLHFGLAQTLKDTQAPVLKSLWVYPIADSSVVNQSNQKVNLVFNKLAPNSFISNKVLANGAIGFAINSYDLMNGHLNHNGLYRIEMWINGSLQYQISFDRFNFAETRYINSYIDYEHKMKRKETLQKLFRGNSFPLSLLAANTFSGVLNVQPNDNYNVIIKLFDFHDNKTEVTIPVAYSNQPAVHIKPQVKTDYLIKADRQNIYQQENVTVTVPKNTFVDDFYMNFEVKNGVLKLHEDVVPGYQNMTFEFDIENTPFAAVPVKKLFIAETSGKTPNYLSTNVKGNKLYTRNRNLGTYQVAIDTVAPKIYGLNFKDGDNLDTKSIIKVNIADEQSGIQSYNGYLNNQWILMEYDYKTKSLVHNLNDNVYVNGENVFKIEVTDKAANKTVLEAKFNKSKNN
ncbi:M23 family metallopeptidase [Flavobacterium agricola]|uniref:M23 family metallopeptidase n=1 Tax=Flavobacterium agricola TaxID=2870839 RepID=A0ABY6M1H3_9FLAO|nr:M23 family metallopeptidase [Flavobacterium agricola]UYW01560.1 M23 family metallopeptidase [Flavobacterium agricola]